MVRRVAVWTVIGFLVAGWAFMAGVVVAFMRGADRVPWWEQTSDEIDSLPEDGATPGDDPGSSSSPS